MIQLNTEAVTKLGQLNLIWGRLLDSTGMD